MRDEISDALKQAMQSKDKVKTNTLRLIMAAIKDRDIIHREHGDGRIPDNEILDVLTKMVKQRVESARLYETGGRLELANDELQEIEIIKEFLPQQLDPEETETACQNAINSCGASGLRDMGKVMETLKGQYPGKMDFGKASGIVKRILG